MPHCNKHLSVYDFLFDVFLRSAWNTVVLVQNEPQTPGIAKNKHTIAILQKQKAIAKCRNGLLLGSKFPLLHTSSKSGVPHPFAGSRVRNYQPLGRRGFHCAAAENISTGHSQLSIRRHVVVLLRRR